MGRKTTGGERGTPQALRSRIVGEGEVEPDQLLANPLNWRKHPKHQLQALEGLLGQVGWVQRVIVNRTTGHVVDGHARVELALRRSEPSVPVLYVELSEEEERLVLASLDPIGGLAETHADNLAEILKGIGTVDESLGDLLQQLRHDVGLGIAEGTMPELSSGGRPPFQQVNFTLHDEQKALIDRALAAAKAAGPFVGSVNENGNGNALARICERYLST